MIKQFLCLGLLSFAVSLDAMKLSPGAGSGAQKASSGSAGQGLTPQEEETLVTLSRLSDLYLHANDEDAPAMFAEIETLVKKERVRAQVPISALRMISLADDLANGIAAEKDKQQGVSGVSPKIDAMYATRIARLEAVRQLVKENDWQPTGPAKKEQRLTSSQREDLITAVGAINGYILANEAQRRAKLAAVSDQFKKKRLYIEVCAENIYVARQPMSMVEWIASEIKELEEKLVTASDTEIMNQHREHIKRYRVVEGILLGHEHDHGFDLIEQDNANLQEEGRAPSDDAKGPQGGAPRRDAGSSNPRSLNSYISSKTAGRVVIFASLLGFGYGIYRLGRYFSQDEKE